ncbi:CBF/Mak21 family-domain-containing protein [Panaeolus papilionaceus]|nr:CBF/Mak21 family-domain-containing protein [Panaeolus papilionaceus]
MPPSLPATKKRKLTKEVDFTQKLKSLEETLTQALSKNGSLNRLADLLSLMESTQDAHEMSKAIYALYRVFVIVISSGKMGLGGDEAAKVVKAWIWERTQTYTDFLGGLLKDEEKFLRTSALQILFSLLKHLSTSYSKSATTSKPQPQFHVSHFRKIVSSLLLCPPSQRKSSKKLDDGRIDADVLDLFYETWFSVHDDIRWFFLRESATLISNHPHDSYPYLATNLLSVLERLTTFPTGAEELNSWWVAEFATKPPKPKKSKSNDDDENDSENENADPSGDGDDDWRKFFEEEKTPEGAKGPVMRLHRMSTHQSLYSLNSHKAVFTRTWLMLLPCLSVSADEETRKALATRALNLMHRSVLPHLTRPFLVMDWISSCVDMGGSVGLLALNALFVMIKGYNLDYPSFYTRLYAFLDRDVLHLKHRSRFFRLTELFLSSTHLPAALLASFIKRLSRLSLSAPPAAIVMVIPFTYNVLKRHPALMYMIHRVDVDGGNDPFLDTEPDPMNTQAIDSSLWELLSHSTHYHAPVSTMTKIFSEAFTKPNYGMEDFLDHTYNTLFETEINRKIKKEPALAMIDDVKMMVIFPKYEAKAAGALGDGGKGSEEGGEGSSDDDESGDDSAEGSGDEGGGGHPDEAKEKKESKMVDVPVRHRDVVAELWGF